MVQRRKVVVYEAKTKPTTLSVAAFLAAIEDDERRGDCKTLNAMMKRVTGCSGKMWGAGIVGFDTYHYKYASGHEGDSCVVGFSSRKDAISVYLLAGYETVETRKLLAQLGKHKIGKACLYIKRLSDIELPVLEQLVVRSVASIKRQYPQRTK